MRQIFKPILVMLAIVAVLAIVNVTPAQATADRAVVSTNLTLAQTDVERIDATHVQDRGAEVMAMAFGGQGLSHKDHRLAISKLRIESFELRTQNVSAETYARLDRTQVGKAYVLKLPPDSPRRPKRFRFTPLTRSIAGAPRDAVIH